MFGASPGRLPSVMNHSFAQVPKAEIPRSSFNRSHGYKTTFDAGYLIPVLVDEVLPGDTINCQATTFARMATPIAPVMDNLYCDSFFFFVPMRLLWTNWEKFNGAKDNPDDEVTYLPPRIQMPAVTGATVGSLSDYFGIPTGIASIYANSFWHRAYNLVWNQWFRDQNLQDSVVVDLDDGPDDYTDYVLLKRGKRHDYFTSCLPWPQKGDAVLLPLGDEAPVLGLGKLNTTFAVGATTLYESNGETRSFAASANIGAASGQEFFVEKQTIDSTNYPYVRADLSNATAATINQLREAFQVQRLLERDARGGTRYVELLKSHFGVTSPDFRLQRSEYLGGGSAPINISPVPQTSATSGSNPLGQLAGFGTFSHHGQGFVKSFTEHGVIIGLVSVRADLNYQQGLNRMWSRRSRYDFYWPALAHIGEQAVLNKEIYCQGNADDDLVFGYQERFAEYRYKPSVITGKFRSTASGTIDLWHLAQKFDSLPTLDDTFIQESPPMTRIMAVNTEPHFKLDVYFKYLCARPMPTYSVPGLIDHF